jgi:hypothetical protein
MLFNRKSLIGAAYAGIVCSMVVAGLMTYMKLRLNHHTHL